MNVLQKKDGMRIARSLKKNLQHKGYPVREVFLFGSVAKGRAHAQSDIDIAVLCEKFLPSRHEENVRFLLSSKEIDVRIQTVCLHPEDFDNRYFALAKDIHEHGVLV
jgi:predicted nucleotidyltransferase